MVQLHAAVQGVHALVCTYRNLVLLGVRRINGVARIDGVQLVAGTVVSYAKDSKATDEDKRTADFNHFVIFDPRVRVLCNMTAPRGCRGATYWP